MAKYIVSAFYNTNEMILKEHILFANDFWDANNKIETILKESGYDLCYMTLSIKET